MTPAATLGLSAALSLFLPSPTLAATLPIYTPGGAPCAGACSLAWAAEQAAVPTGIPVPMVIRAGTLVEWMSYSKAGAPLSFHSPMILASDQPGIGYHFTDEDGVGKIMFQLDECANWAVVREVPQVRISTGPAPVLASFLTPARVPTPATFYHYPGSYGGGNNCCSISEPPPPPPIEPPPAPIPILPAFWMTLGALMGLGVLALNRRR